MRKVITNYDDLPQADWVEFLVLIIACGTNNANFPDFPFTMVQLAAKKSAYDAKIVLSKQGNHVATEEAKTIRIETSTMVKKNGNYINETAEGNVAKLESSGYKLAKEYHHHGKQDYSFTNGDTRDAAKIVVPVIEGGVTYLGFVCEEPLAENIEESAWVRLKMSTSTTMVATGLKVRVLYYFRYCASTVDGETVLTEPVTFSIT